MLLTTDFTNYHVLISLFFESILPYIKSKIEKWVAEDGDSAAKKVLSALVRVGEILIFIYQFKHLVDPKFVHFKPYLHFFRIAVRFYNGYEQKQVAKQYEKRPILSFFKQYSIFALFLAMEACRWYFSTRDSN